MNEWKESKLGDYVNVINGFAFKSVNFLDIEIEESMPVIKIKNVANGDTNLNGVQYHLYEKSLSKYVINKGDILITLTGNHPEAMTQVVGDVSKYKLERKSLLNQRVAKIEAKDNITKEFIYYFLKNDEAHDFLASQSAGSANQANISKTNIESMPVRLPSVCEQIAIVEVLSSLDDKIDLLHRQNKTLEQLAETLFRQWFVEEAEESWEVGTIEDEFEFTMGQSPLGADLNENGEGIIFYQGRTDFGFRFPTPRIYTTTPTRLAKSLDTLISVRAPVGDMNMAFEECCLGRGVAAFRYKHNNNFYSYTYYKMRSLMQQIKQFEDNGSVFGSIGKEDFKKLENIIPRKELIVKFNNEVNPFDDKVLLNTKQIQILSQLRKTLLPKLMSGEIRVNY